MLNGRNVLNMVLRSLAVTAVVCVAMGHILVLGDSVGRADFIGNPYDYSFSPP